MILNLLYTPGTVYEDLPPAQPETQCEETSIVIKGNLTNFHAVHATVPALHLLRSIQRISTTLQACTTTQTL